MGGIPITFTTLVNNCHVTVFRSLFVQHYSIELTELKRCFVSFIVDTDCESQRSVSLFLHC